jgi:hypothetical protein
MEKRSLIAYEHYTKANQRFEYFLTSIIGAMCAYIANSFAPKQFGLNHNSLELLSLLILAMSFYFSIKRLHGVTMMHRISSERLDLYEKRGALVVNSNEPSIINEETGDILNSQDIINEIGRIDKVIPGIEKHIDKHNKILNRYYNLRFYFLYFGFILLIASKVWSAYQ